MHLLFNKKQRKVTNKYNAQADLISTSRTVMQLKKLWTNLKQRKRKATTELKYKRLLTGGGPEPEIDEEDPVMEAVNTAAPYADVTILCPWDSTKKYDMNTASTSLEVSDSFTPEVEVEEVANNCPTSATDSSAAIQPDTVQRIITVATPRAAEVSNTPRPARANILKESQMRIKKNGRFYIPTKRTARYKNGNRETTTEDCNSSTIKGRGR